MTKAMKSRLTSKPCPIRDFEIFSRYSIDLKKQPTYLPLAKYVQDSNLKLHIMTYMHI